MDKRTLTALKASIQHWRENAEASTPSSVYLGPHDCALCREFNVLGTPYYDRCSGCPVKDKTGKMGCSGTPYDDAEAAFSDWDDTCDDDIARDAWRAAAQAEIDFLISLLPEGETA